MNRTVEIKNSIADKKALMSGLKSEGKIEEAYAVLSEIKSLQKELEIENSLNEPSGKLEDESKLTKANKLSAFNKAVRGRRLTEAENALVEKTDEKGGYLVPEEQRTEIEELKRSLNALKQYCNVVPVTTLSGTFPIEVDSNGKLIEFDENETITEGDISFSRISWSVKNAGLLMPVSDQLLADEKANLLRYIDRHFAKRAVRTENEKIVAKMKEATQYAGTDYKAILKALNTQIDTAVSAAAKIFTNQDGFDYLDCLTDANGRPLLQVDIKEPTKMMFRGHEIVKLNNSEYTAATDTFEFWVGDLNAYCSFFDRMTLEVAISKEAGFKQYSTYLRAVERFDVGKVDSAAGVRVVITVTA